ncbi:alpha/beta fold hydrolase [Gryllotalpicola protaetiae]|uniref:Alpha/beta hydrolase n=1 Tax=Gryllotalpicola protaetiae TaxID=2419771 RepID=A0A387BQE2_9MICO|nr:alpha/beta hydrolase [Gryllotalpicola protaetiae]AYG03250.1 alpha/beta hydrolase [Gryllotalpicola protaetiae]
MTIVLIHGAATRADVWNPLVAALGDLDRVIVPQRDYSGDWGHELGALEPLCAGALVVGVSGGATLGLELALRGVPLRGAVLHEPAAGSYAPALLDHVAAAWRENGVDGFGSALYGPAWSRKLSPSASAVARDFAMFRRFEPYAPSTPLTHVLLTSGERSPESRHMSVQALSRLTGARTTLVPGASHAVHLEAGAALASLVRSEHSRSPTPALRS